MINFVNFMHNYSNKIVRAKNLIQVVAVKYFNNEANYWNKAIFIVFCQIFLLYSGEYFLFSFELFKEYHIWSRLSVHKLWFFSLNFFSTGSELISYIYLFVYFLFYISISKILGARGVMVIVVGNGHGNTSSNPGPG